MFKIFYDFILNTISLNSDISASHFIPKKEIKNFNNFTIKSIFIALALAFLSNTANAAAYSCSKIYSSCSSGYYLNGSVCSACPGGCSCSGGTSQPSCSITCSAGYAWNGSSCEICNNGGGPSGGWNFTGLYCPGVTVSAGASQTGWVACTNKPANSYYTNTSGPTTNSCSWACSSGYHLSGGNCAANITSCPDRQYLVNWYDDSCTDVGSGYYSDAGDTARHLCPGGYSGSNGSFAGIHGCYQYNSYDDTVANGYGHRDWCHYGTGYNVSQAQACSSNLTIDHCNAGYISTGSSCGACNPGYPYEPYYCPGDDNRYRCPTTDGDLAALSGGTVISHNPGGWCSGGATSSSVYQCMGDSEITMYNGTYLAECSWNGSNYFQNCGGNYLWWGANPGYYLYGYKWSSGHDWYTGATACTNKPANSYYTGAGSPETNNCPWSCDNGYYNVGGSCNVATNCPTGQFMWFWSGDNRTYCEQCHANYYCPGGLNIFNSGGVGSANAAGIVPISSCPSGWTDNSSLGKSAPEQCLKACGNQSISNGYIPPDSSFANYPNNCTWTGNAVCNSGYYTVGNTCVQCEGGPYYCNNSVKHNCIDAALTQGTISDIFTYVDNIVNKGGAWDAAQCLCRWSYSDSTRLTYFYQNNCISGPSGNTYTQSDWCRSGYYLTEYINDSYGNSCSACTNAPSNSYYTTRGNQYANDCPWSCNSGYGLTDTGSCSEFCTAGFYTLNLGSVSIPIYNTKNTSTALNVKSNSGSMCYGSLASGSVSGAINIKDSLNNIYHAIK